MSTGAILATHAFLGRDEQIEAKYTELSGRQIYRKRLPIEYLWANSLYDTVGKDALIAGSLTTKIIDEVEREHQKADGRFLYIGVVNMDTGEFWRIDMGALASTLPKSI